MKIKSLCESLASIGVTIDDDDKVEVDLHSLGNAYKQFKTSIRTWEKIHDLEVDLHDKELTSMLVVEEKSLIDDGVI